MKALLALTALLAAALPTLAMLTALLLSTSAQGSACQPPGETPTATAGAWVATAYGPPWGGIQGDGITTTGLNLTAGPPAYEIAVDPSVIPLGSYVHITPNPFGTSSAFYAGDTGSAITGRHIDIYDWHGRASQNAWGARTVTITPAPNPSAGDLLDGVAPTPTAGEETRNARAPAPARAHRRPNRAHPTRRERHRARMTHPPRSSSRSPPATSSTPAPTPNPTTLRHPHPALARLRLLRRHLVRALRRRAPRPHRP